MGRSALLFAGQGTQYVGMGKELYESFEAAKSVFDKANQILGSNLKKLCFEGPKEELDKTINTQPAVFTFNMAAYYAISNLGGDKPLPYIFVGGHSLGEVCAAVASKALTLEQGLAIVQMRARFMHEAASVVDGSMIAVIGLASQEIEALIKGIDGLYLSNFNSSLQTTISGPTSALIRAKDVLQGKAKVVVDLAVSGAFHSPYMQPAADELSKYLDNINFSDMEVELVANVDAKPKKMANEIKDSLIKQLDHPVQFVKMLEYMAGQGVDTYIEVGPGKTLANLIKRTVSATNVYTTDTIESMKKFLEVAWT